MIKTFLKVSKFQSLGMPSITTGYCRVGKKGHFVDFLGMCLM